MTALDLLPAEFELLLKVLSSPDDDAPRLVYADVLQERGDPRGEFIPLQCELARWSTRADPHRFRALRAREGALLTEHGRAWIEQAIPFRCIGFFHRGFVEELQCLAGELLHRGLELVAPVRVLRLDGDSSAEVAQRVMALPRASRVEELTLRLVDSPLDGSLGSSGESLKVLRQLSAEANTIELLDQLGWLARLERLELPLTPEGGAWLEDLASCKPPRLEQLWLQRQHHAFGREVLRGIEAVWAALPALTVRWRSVDYRSSDQDALVQALDPYRARIGQLLISADPAWAEGEPLAQGPTLLIPDLPDASAVSAPMERIGLSRPPPSTAPWDRWLQPEGLSCHGFLPRAVPQSVTLVRAEQNGVPLLVALGPVDSFGAQPFTDDVGRLMSLPRDPGLLRIERTGVLEQARWAAFESFEGVSLWELLQLHQRLPPAVVLRVLGQTARAASKVEAWQPSADDVLLDALGRLRLLPGFPGSLRTEEPSYTGREDRHPLGAPPEDEQDPGARVVQLGTALFELLTGTRLFEISGRSILELAADWYQLVRLLGRGGLSLLKVDPALARFEPLLAKALSHAHSARFAGLSELADALEAHPDAAPQAEVARLVREALAQIPRTRDGR